MAAILPFLLLPTALVAGAAVAALVGFGAELAPSVGAWAPGEEPPVSRVTLSGSTADLGPASGLGGVVACVVNSAFSLSLSRRSSLFCPSKPVRWFVSGARFAVAEFPSVAAIVEAVIVKRYDCTDTSVLW